RGGGGRARRAPRTGRLRGPPRAPGVPAGRPVERRVPRRSPGRGLCLAPRRRSRGPARGHRLPPGGGSPMNAPMSTERAMSASLRRVAVVAREEYRRALETRWLFVFTALFALLVLGLSYFGLAQS